MKVIKSPSYWVTLFYCLFIINSNVYAACEKNCLLQKATTIINQPANGRYDAGQIAIGDVNNDQRDDVVFLSEDAIAGPNPGYLWVFIQQDDGTLPAEPKEYWLQQVTSLDKINNSAVAIGDMNGDQKNDVVISTQNGIGVMLQNAQGTLDTMFTAGQTGQLNIRHLILAHVNNDSLLDVVAISHGNDLGEFYIYYQNENGLQAPISVTDVGISGFPVAADFDGNQMTDIAYLTERRVNGTLTRFVSLRYQDQNGFAEAQDFQINSSVHSMAAGDVNGDELADIVVATGTDGVNILIQDQQNGLQEAKSFPEVGSGWVEGVHLALLDNKPGYEIIARSRDNRIETMRLTSAEPLTYAIDTFVPGGGNGGESTTIASGDLNGDGKNDVFIANNNSNLISAFYSAHSELSVSVQPVEEVHAGNEFIYDLTVKNQGPDVATASTLTLHLGESVYHSSVATLSNGGSCSGSSGTVVCDLGSVGVDETVTIQVPVTSREFGVKPLTIEVDSYEFETAAEDNSAGIETNVLKSADLAVSFSGVSISYTNTTSVSLLVFVDNSGPYEAENTVVEIDLPPNSQLQRAEWFPAAVIANPCSLNEGTVTCEMGTVPKSDFPYHVELEFTTSQPSGQMTIAARALTSSPDRNENNNTFEDTRTILTPEEIAAEVGLPSSSGGSMGLFALLSLLAIALLRRGKI